MKCACGGRTRVRESRQTISRVRRRRECRKCGDRFTTYECKDNELPRSAQQHGENDAGISSS